MSDWLQLPDDLPVPEDDGAAAHLTGLVVPDIPLPSTSGTDLDLADLSRAKSVVVYAFPRTGVPGQPNLVPDWDAIPGARGCTPESCGFRDIYADLAGLGVVVLGLSTQDTAYQAEAVERLHLPFAMLSDEAFRLTDALRLPTFEAAGQRLLRRLTLLVTDGIVEHVWYPVFPPDTHAQEVLRWLQARRATAS
jgi:peroxiredoxin